MEKLIASAGNRTFPNDSSDIRRIFCGDVWVDRVENGQNNGYNKYRIVSRGEKTMGDKNIKKEVKKKKKTDTKNTSTSAVLKPVVVQPTLIKKKKNDF